MLAPQTPSPQQQELLRLFRRLDERARNSLLDFARYLAARETPDAAQDASPAEPLGLPRPEEETVVAAMRRLSRNYPMLNKDELLHQAAALMNAHVMQGRPAVEVIDELEALFEAAWRRYAGLDD
jgi:hypothetical protein